MKKLIPVVASLLIVSSCIPVVASANAFGDINNDGLINASDAACILEYAAYVGATGGELSLESFMNIQEVPEQTEPSKNTFSDSEQVVDYIASKFALESRTTMAASMIDAINGVKFIYNGNKFEVYQLKDGDTRLSEIDSSGKVTLNISGFGSFETNACRNGNFIMTYDTANDEIINAFLQ